MCQMQNNGIVTDVAYEILKHVKHPDDGYKIWNIEVSTNFIHNLTQNTQFELRIKDSKNMHLKAMKTNMSLDLSDVKKNVELYHCSHLNLKAIPLKKKLETFIQLHIDSSVILTPAKFNGKYLRDYPDSPPEEQQSNSNHQCHLTRVYYIDFIEDIVKLCIGYKLGYYEATLPHNNLC